MRQISLPFVLVVHCFQILITYWLITVVLLTAYLWKNKKNIFPSASQKLQGFEGVNLDRPYSIGNDTIAVAQHYKVKALLLITICF